MRKAMRKIQKPENTWRITTVGINESTLHGQLLKKPISIREYAHLNHNSDSIPDSGDCGKGINQTSVYRCAKKADVCRFQIFGWGGKGGGGSGGTGGDCDYKNLVGRTLPKLSFQARAQYCEWDKLKHAAILFEDQQM